MPRRSSSLTTIPLPILLVGAWLATVVVIALLIYAIFKAAINKTDARDLPKVLLDLTHMLGALMRPLNHALSTSSSAPSVTAPQETTPQEQTGGQGIETTERDNDQATSRVQRPGLSDRSRRGATSGLRPERPSSA